MPQSRHQIFQHIASALKHEQNGNGTLALAFWENVLRLLPDEIPVHYEILNECRRLVEEEVSGGSAAEGGEHPKIQALTESYQQERSEEEDETSEYLYKAICQQCGNNYALSLVYWKTVRQTFPVDSLAVTLAVQDFCWIADQFVTARQTVKSIELYRQLLATFPEFLEGYINLSLILFHRGLEKEILPLLDQVPQQHQETFIVQRYKEFFQTIQEISTQFGQVPYAALEEFINDLRVENTFYPSIAGKYFDDIVEELVSREKAFFERRRKSLEEKAIARTNKLLAEEGTPLGLRVTMAKQAGLEDIPKFLYDNDIRVAEVLLNNSNMTADDVLVMAQTAHVSEVLGLIARSRKWGTIHKIRMAILLNPQTYPKDAVRLLELLNIQDLAVVASKKTIPTEVRIRAQKRIQHIFNQELSMYEKFAIIEATSGSLLKQIEQVDCDLASFLVNLIGKYQHDAEIITNLCLWRLTPASILAMIGKNSEFTSNIQILFALLSNPRTPSMTITTVAQHISEKNLRDLMLNPRIPDATKQHITDTFPGMFP